MAKISKFKKPVQQKATKNIDVDKKPKSFSQIAREILLKGGSRSKASAKLKELKCSSASAVVAKVAGKMGIPPEKKTRKEVVVVKRKSKEKDTTKRKLKKKIKKIAPEEVELDEDDLLDEDEELFEDDDF